MGSLTYLTIVACALAILLAHSSAFPRFKAKKSLGEKVKTKESVNSNKMRYVLKEKKELTRKARELRPSFVKRNTQAPLLHAGNEKIEEEYIVKLKDDLTVEELAAFEERLQALCEEKGLHVEFHLNITALMKGFVAKVTGEALDILRWMDEVEYVEEDEVVHATTTWGLDRIDQADLPLDDVYSSSPLGDGSGVSVFVLDTGIRYSHVEFGQRAKFFYDAFNDGYDGYDCQGHGTHCAGTVGGNTVGVAPGATLYAGRVLSCQGSGSISGIVGGMDAVAASGIKPGVVSMSLGGGFSVSLNDAVKKLTDAGYPVIAAAGNENTDACSRSPASAPEAITVGATTSSDALASYSNYGSCVDILAPGSSVYSSVNTGDNDYDSFSGTSMATPHVAGVAALILQQNPSLTPGQVASVLRSAAQSGKISQIPDSSTPNKLLHIPDDVNPPPATAAPPTDAPTDGICENTCQYAHDGECDDGGPGSAYDVCDLGTDCGDCGPRPPPGICENTCQYANDGECDDGGPGSAYDVCDYGTDCGDCGPRDPPTDTPTDAPPCAQVKCENTCSYSGDGECDDGGPGSQYNVCELGTDCEDCGPRVVT